MNMHVGSDLAMELHRQAVERRRRMGMAPPAPRPVVIPVARISPPTETLARVLYPHPIGPVHVLDRARDYIDVRTTSDIFKVQRIIDEVLQKHSMTKTDFFSARRHKPLVNCRHEACYRLRHETKLSLPQIARAVGVCDHSVAIYAIRRVTRLIESGEWSVYPASLAAE